jgi:hypothetical protein
MPMAADEDSCIVLKTLRARFLAPLGTTVCMGFFSSLQALAEAGAMRLSAQFLIP